MADTYASRDARRRAAMAEALMGGAMTAPQGGMVGRYYVGEGIGSGLTRIGQALLASRMGKQADEAENEYQAGQMAKRDAAMTGLINDITAPREETVQDFGNVAVTQNRKPSNQEIGAALLKYQNDTGMEVPKDIVGLLAPQAGGNDLAFGSTLRKNGRTYQLTKSGQLIDLGEGFDEPTRALDVGGAFLIQPTQGAPRTLGTVKKGVSPDKVYDVQSAPDKAASVAATEAKARAEADREQAAKDAEKSQGEIGAILDETENLLGKGSGSIPGAVASNFRTKVGMANETDEANARLDVLSANLLGEYARSKILGPNPSEGDRRVYEDMAGRIADKTLDPSVRMAAVDQIRKMAAARAQSARVSSQPQAKPSGAPRSREDILKAYGVK